MSPRLGAKVSSQVALIGALVLGTAAPATAGIDPEQNIDGFDPAAESFRINEARRLNAISRQLELTYRMMWLNGHNPASPPIRQPIGQETIQLGPNKWLSRPVYDHLPGDDAVGPEAIETSPVVPELLPAPEAQGPMLVPPGPADAKAGDQIPPQPDPAPKKQPLGRRPREF
jgi:hypothetical protein